MFNRIWICPFCVSHSFSILAILLSISSVDSCFLRNVYWAFNAYFSCFDSKSFIFVIDFLYSYKIRWARVTTILFSFYLLSNTDNLYSIFLFAVSAVCNFYFVYSPIFLKLLIISIFWRKVVIWIYIYIYFFFSWAYIND